MSAFSSLSPVPASEFVSQLKIKRVKFDIAEYNNTWGLAIGTLGRSMVAFPNWYADITLGELRQEEARVVKAKIRRIGDMNSFEVYNPESPYPAWDPDGSKLAGYSPKIIGIGSDNRSIKIGNLPPSFRLNWGDFGSITYSGRKFLFEVCDTRTADSSGSINTALQINPPLRSGIVINNPINFAKPVCKMWFTSRDVGFLDGDIAADTTLQAMEVV